jgi:hypothetical protein
MNFILPALIIIDMIINFDFSYGPVMVRQSGNLQ